MIEKRYYGERSRSDIVISDTPPLGYKTMSAGFMGTFLRRHLRIGELWQKGMPPKENDAELVKNICDLLKADVPERTAINESFQAAVTAQKNTPAAGAAQVKRGHAGRG